VIRQIEPTIKVRLIAIIISTRENALFLFIYI